MKINTLKVVTSYVPVGSQYIERERESDARSMADLLSVKDNDRHLQSAARGHCSP